MSFAVFMLEEVLTDPKMLYHGSIKLVLLSLLCKKLFHWLPILVQIHSFSYCSYDKRFTLLKDLALKIIAMEPSTDGLYCVEGPCKKARGHKYK